ncbi:hypothetical protein G7046_g9782 [Stylonectria norvegica]|nr:hypothetical protein G7046_g9782 [Stylonectria norvegica]
MQGPGTKLLLHLSVTYLSLGMNEESPSGVATATGMDAARKKEETGLQPTSEADNQEKSLFFRILPQEIRDEIYRHVFNSTRLSYGRRILDVHMTITIKTSPSALALLRTNRRITKEIGKSWLGQLLFNFESLEAMLHKLTALPVDIVSRIRRVRVFGDHIRLQDRDPRGKISLQIVLAMIPNLCLDVLTVLCRRADSHHVDSYTTLESLIEDSCGWKELRYISNNSALVAFTIARSWEIDGRIFRLHEPPLARWQRVLDERDGACTTPTIAMYRSTELYRPNSNFHAKTRVPLLYASRAQSKALQNAQTNPNRNTLKPAGEGGEDVMIIVRRGLGVDYEQKEDSVYVSHQINESWAQGKNWKDICRQYLGLHGDVDVDKDEGFMIDVYGDAEDYMWPPWCWYSYVRG